MKLVVENLMSEPVYEVDVTDPVKKALDIMNQKGTKKILVKSGTRPEGVLEKWKITKQDLDLKVGQMKLGMMKVVPIGTLISDVKRTLVDNSAIYVSDVDDPEKIVGVVTTYDLVKRY